MTTRTKKLRVFSGIQPSGELHVGNYLGALKQWLPLQKTHGCFFSIVDLHAITVPYHQVELQGRVFSAALDYLAAGIDPKEAVMFVQSHVPEHTELTWLLNTITPVAELERMTQFKEKAGINRNIIGTLFWQELKKLVSQKITEINNENIKFDDVIKELETYQKSDEYIKTLNRLLDYARGNAAIGLLDYPVLMAADILLYKTDIVPVGEDQEQHVELARVLARKFNQRFGEVFVEPKAQLTEAKRIMSLADPSKKMSKSLGPKHYIALTDSPDVIRDKVSKAVTDVGGSPTGEMSPAVASLFLLLDEFAPKESPRFRKAYEAKTIRYVEMKKVLAEAIVKTLRPFQKKRADLAKRPKAVWKILNDGAKKARPIARATLKEAKERMGLA